MKSMGGKNDREQPLQERVLAVMGRKGYRASTRNELSKVLSVSAESRAELRAAIADLVKEGKVIQGRHNRYELRNGRKSLLTGRIRVFPKGHGSFRPDTADEANKNTGIDLAKLGTVYIPARKMNTAMNGDLVLVELEQKREPVWKLHRARGRARGGRSPRPSAQEKDKEELTGRVERVLERTGGLLVGTLQKTKGRYYLETDDPSQPPEIIITEHGSAKPGQKVGVELVHWASRLERPRGVVAKILGWPHDAGIDILSIIMRNGLRMEFPQEVLDEAANISETIPPRELKRREDWRDKLVVTIDPASARDHDDAVWVQKEGDGWRLGVHIADVSHYVKADTAMDKEAFARGNSTYLPDRVLPMIPEKLSNGICSLRPDEDRLTKAVELLFDELGRVKQASFFDAVICSQAKLAYEEAQVVIEGGRLPEALWQKLGKRGPELKTMLHEAWALAKVLRHRRFEQGALDLEMSEIRLEFDEKGDTTGYSVEEYNESHQLIEEFMLAANEAVARKLQNQRRPAIYRVHEDPDPEKLEEYAQTAKLYGYEPGDLTNRKHIQKLLRKARGTPEEHAIKLGLLKSLKRAFYSEEGRGHYGLAKGNYAHFTSPIRRYADLVVHRALQGIIENRASQSDPFPKLPECAQAAGHISQTERMSAAAEDEARRLKLLQWLEKGRTLPNPPVFNAVVTDVRSMGAFAEIIEMGQRGLIRRDMMGDGRWNYRDERKEFVSGRGKSISLGTQLRVVVQGIDFTEQRVDFNILEILR